MFKQFDVVNYESLGLTNSVVLLEDQKNDGTASCLCPWDNKVHILELTSESYVIGRYVYKGGRRKR